MVFNHRLPRLKSHHVPHATIIASLALLALGAFTIWRSHYSLAAIVPISTLLATIPVTVSFGLQTVTQGIVAGRTLRAEGELRAGLTIEYSGKQGTVESIRLRTTIIETPRGRMIAPNTMLLTAGFEVIEHPDATDTP